MSLPIKKIYVNSRYKTADSISDSNFKFEIPYVLTMPHNAIFYVTDVCKPKLFKTISRDENDDLYFEYTTSSNGVFDIATVRIVGSITLPPGNYTEIGFAQALGQKLNNITNGAIRAQYDSGRTIYQIAQAAIPYIEAAIPAIQAML